MKPFTICYDGQVIYCAKKDMDSYPISQLTPKDLVKVEASII